MKSPVSWCDVGVKSVLGLRKLELNPPGPLGFDEPTIPPVTGGPRLALIPLLRGAARCPLLPLPPLPPRTRDGVGNAFGEDVGALGMV